MFFDRTNTPMKKTFSPWNEDNKTPSSFLKRVRETQTQATKDVLESVLDQNVEPNFRPKHPCACPKIVLLLLPMPVK